MEDVFVFFVLKAGRKQHVYTLFRLEPGGICAEEHLFAAPGAYYPAQMVKERFGQINSLHIQYVSECLENTASRIRNIRQYLLATLFNAPVTKGSYYDARVRYDRSLGWLCPPAKAAQV